MRKILVAIVLATSTLGCSDDGGDDNGGGSATIAGGPVTGKVGGQPWTLASAQVDAFLSDENFWVDLSAETLASCNDFGSGNALILNVPKKVGTYALSLMLNGTFVVECDAQTQNLIAIEGSLRVDEVTTALVRGGVNMTYDTNNTVNGEFEAIVCE